MFRVESAKQDKFYRRPIAILIAFNVAALLLALWVMNDLLQEQELIRAVIRQLPPGGVQSANDLASELVWQFRMSVLLTINLITTAIGMVLLWRAYHVSQESLRDVRAQAIDILSSMDQAVITTDLHGLITSMNRRAKEFLELDTECYGMPLRDAGQATRLDDFRQQTMKGGFSRPWMDLSLQTAERAMKIRAYCQPLRSRESQKVGSILQLRDVTEITLVEEQISRMERFMGLGTLVAGLYHEVKNPLAALSLYVQLMSERFENQSMDDESKGMLSVVKVELGRVNSVLESFRDFASAGNVNRTRVNLKSLIERQITLIRPQAASLHIDVEWSDSYAKNWTVSVDETKIEQLLLNLLLNAMESMKDGGNIKVQLSERVDFILVRIEDNGNGIPEAIRHRIFDPYFTTKVMGSGMGLAICEKIARQHNGSLVYRPLKKGSSFELSLPKRADHSEDSKDTST